PIFQEQELLIAPISDSPKPPPQRVTMTFPLLNNSKSVIFVATGASKASVIKKILEGNSGISLPAARVRPRSGKLRWLLDEAAAQELEIPVERWSQN
ncbi:6PGL phosphogluconolactonase, partial [Origma solitaria]|nr:6PGL phosphogluconolactonase [Origma solitaria]